MMQQKVRIVITGTGVVSCIGISTQTFWENALKGVNGIREIKRFDTSDLRTHKAGEVYDFDSADYMPKDQVNTMGRASHFAVATSRMALEEAGLDDQKLKSFDPTRLAVTMGTTMGEPEILDTIATGVAKKGLSDFPHDLIFPLPSFRIPNSVARIFGFKGSNYQIPTACTAGNHAIGYGTDLLRMGRADLVLAGGSDAFSRIAFVGFNKLLAHAPDRCQPFDKNRAGMMISEGAGCVVLERLEDALYRGAPILAEILDYGVGCDASKMTIPHPEGLGGIIAFRQAMKLSGLCAEDVDFVCTHGTGTKENDKVETIIIKENLKEHAYKIKINSIKSMIGHSMGAASAIEAIVCARMTKEGIIPPTINYEEPDPECDLDCVPNKAQKYSVNIAASNAYAFGGNCSTLIIKRYAEEA